MRGSPAALLLLLLAVASGAGRATAQPLTAERVVSVHDGNSGAMTQAVALDATGFLWSGSQLGLDRWDGVRMRGFEVRGGALALTAAPGGGLWSAGDDGLSFLASPEGPARRLVDPDAPDGPLSSSIRALALDGADGVWIGTLGRGLAHVRLSQRRYARVSGLPSDSVLALAAPAPGWLWLGTPLGVVRLHLPTRRMAPLLPIGRVTACVPEASRGDRLTRVWCATRDGRIHALDAASGRALGLPWSAGAEVSALVASQTRPGTLWVGTRGAGLQMLDTATGVFAPALAESGPERADVLCLLEDAAGLLWIGAVGGLYRADARPPPFSPGAAPEQAPLVPALHVSRAAPGVLWLGTIRDGLTRLDRVSGARQTWTGPPGTPLSVLLALHEDAQGQLWLGGPGGAIHRFDPATGTTTPLPISSAPGTVVYHLAGDVSRPGVLWAGLSTGLAEVDIEAGRVRSRWAADAPAAQRLRTGAVWSSAADGASARWVATTDAGLVRLDLTSGRATPVGPACGLDGEVRAVAYDAEGHLWVTRLGALVRFDARTGQCRAFAPDDGVQTDFHGVTVDARGRVWATTRATGLLRYDPSTETWVRYTTADGLPTDAYYIPGHHLAQSGEWLIGGMGGWTAFRPEIIGARETPARVVLTGLLVDGRPARIPHERLLRLGPTQNDLAVSFAALDLRQPGANRYRVRLERAGTPPDPWTTLGATAQVRLPFLAPGRYLLRVSGAGPEGRWAEAPPLAFVIPPPWWQRPWAWALGVLLVAGAVGAWQQARIRQMRREDATRRRIADDLHDDIGSKMSTVALRLDLAGRSGALGEADRERLAEIARTARGVVVSLRDAVWLVDAGHDGLDALADRIETAARAILDGRPLAVERTGALPALALPMETRRHILLWAREALNNAAKYSEGRVRLRLAATAATLTLAVEDDGPGFDPAGGAGRGLKTLSTRAEAIGGAHVLESAPGAGTRMTLTVPLASSRRLARRPETSSADRLP